MSTLKIKRENGKIFCPLADSWHIETPEEKVRQEYIKILVENYGYSLDQMAQEIKVNNSQRGQGKARADIVIWKSKQTGYNLSSRNLIWDAGRVGLVVSHNGVNDGDHLPAGVAHGRHVGLPFIPFFLEIKLQRRIVKYCR